MANRAAYYFMTDYGVVCHALGNFSSDYLALLELRHRHVEYQHGVRGLWFPGCLAPTLVDKAVSYYWQSGPYEFAPIVDGGEIISYMIRVPTQPLTLENDHD